MKKIRENVLVKETIEKYGYDVLELKGKINYSNPVICLCIECKEQYEIRFENCFSKKEIKPCGKCSNRRNGKQNAEKISKRIKEKYLDGTLTHGMIGKTHTELVKQKARERLKGKKWEELYGEEKAKDLKKERSEWMLENNPYKGKKHSPEIIEKIKISIKNKIRRGNESNFYGKKYWPKKNNFIYNDTKFRSNWEIAVVKYFDEKQIKWLYEPNLFKIGEHNTYTPDFYLPETNEYIEVKGYFTEENKQKMIKFINQYPNIKVEIWDEIKLKELKILK